jgi:hypothetical protein
MINRLGFRRLEACIHWKIGNYQYDEKTKNAPGKITNKQETNCTSAERETANSEQMGR